MLRWRQIAVYLFSPLLVFSLGFGFGWITAPKPKAPAPFPSSEQLTIASSTLVHGLEVQNDYSLAQAPDFIACRKTMKPASGIACDFRVTYYDESSATWELTLDSKNIPVVIKRLRQAPAPPSS